MITIHDVIEYYKPINRMIIRYHKNGKPETINFGNYKNEIIKSEKHHTNGNIKEKNLFKNTHRICMIKYYKNGNKKYEQWYNEINQSHRKYGPSYKEYYSNGNIRTQVYYINGYRHRVNGPAIITYEEDGSISFIQWGYNKESFTNQVNQWMKNNNFNSYKEMTEDDYNRMWMEIL